MPNYPKLAATALRLIQAAGCQLDLRDVAMLDYNPLNPAISARLVRSCVANIVELPLSESALIAFDEKIVLRPQILTEQRLIYIAAKGLDFEPKIGMMLGETWRITACTPLNPNRSTPLLYKVHVTNAVVRVITTFDLSCTTITLDTTLFTLDMSS